MKTVIKNKLYEAMFLVDSALAASDWDGINAAIKKILNKAKAKILYMKKWDERKLAYNIRGISRGTYILCYFKAPSNVIHQIERDVQLSEKIVRALLLRADYIDEKDIEQKIPAVPSEQKLAPETKEKEDIEKAITEQDITVFSFDEDLKQMDQLEDIPDYEMDIEDEQKKTQ